MMAKKIPACEEAQAGANNGFSADNSKRNYTKTAGRAQGGIAALLPRGRENAISWQALAKRAGCRSKRELQVRIAAERESGGLILSSTDSRGGYFAPGCIDELVHFERMMSSKALSILKVLRAVRREIRKQGADYRRHQPEPQADGQYRLDGFTSCGGGGHAEV